MIIDLMLEYVIFYLGMIILALALNSWIRKHIEKAAKVDQANGELVDLGLPLPIEEDLKKKKGYPVDLP